MNYNEVKNLLDNLIESFDNPLPYTKKKDDEFLFEYNDYVFKVIVQTADKVLSINEMKNTLYVNFYLLKDNKEIEQLSNVFSSGKSIRIFSTIIKIVEDVFNAGKYEGIMFHANNKEKSRVSLYKKIGNLFAKTRGFHHIFKKGKYTSVYYLTKKLDKTEFENNANEFVV